MQFSISIKSYAEQISSKIFVSIYNVRCYLSCDYEIKKMLLLSVDSRSILNVSVLYSVIRKEKPLQLIIIY